MQEEAQEYKEESKLRELVAQYSEFINFPIYLWTTKETEVEVPDEEAEAAAAAAKEDKSDEDIEDEGAPGFWTFWTLVTTHVNARMRQRTHQSSSRAVSYV